MGARCHVWMDTSQVVCQSLAQAGSMGLEPTNSTHAREPVREGGARGGFAARGARAFPGPLLGHLLRDSKGKGNLGRVGQSGLVPRGVLSTWGSTGQHLGGGGSPCPGRKLRMTHVASAQTPWASLNSEHYGAQEGVVRRVWRGLACQSRPCTPSGRIPWA